MFHPHAAYWNRGESQVPITTGAGALLDAQDLREVIPALGLSLPLRNVLDVGCGTGRLAQLCEGYAGLDIADDAVAYCRHRGLWCQVISGPAFVVPDVTVITCISVFTHMGREERQAYLATFARLAPTLIVDIIPGDGSGDVPCWTADPDVFRADLADAGFAVVAEIERAWDQHTHRYYRAERSA